MYHNCNKYEKRGLNRLNHEKNIHINHIKYKCNQVLRSCSWFSFYTFFFVMDFSCSPSIVVFIIKMRINPKCLALVCFAELMKWENESSQIESCLSSTAKSSSISNPMFPSLCAIVCYCGWWLLFLLRLMMLAVLWMFWLTWPLFWININHINVGEVDPRLLENNDDGNSNIAISL